MLNTVRDPVTKVVHSGKVHLSHAPACFVFRNIPPSRNPLQEGLLELF
jgi:hypothetical protein